MIICADDFGLTPDIVRAILTLADKGRITAVSSLVALPNIEKTHFQSLAKLAGNLDLGLHLNLTDVPPLSAPAKVASLIASNLYAFRQLLVRSLSGRIRPSEAALEMAEQYNRFIDLFGRPPDFVDSHFHVHQFPGIRDGLLEFLATLPPERRPYIRNTWMPPVKIFRQRVAVLKTITISLFGLALKQRLKSKNMATNEGFAGIYNYSMHRNFPKYLAEFIRYMEPGKGILMVHPGLNDAWRRTEYNVLLETTVPPVFL